MAFMEAQLNACFPDLNCSTCIGWQAWQVSGVGIKAFSASASEVCCSPWHTEHSMPFLLCLLSCQSVTMLGVVFLWQSTQLCSARAGKLANRKIKGTNRQCRIIARLRELST